MKIVLSLIAVAVVAAGGGLIALQSQATNRLRAEVLALREEVRELSEHEKARRQEAKGYAQADMVQSLQHESDRAEVAALREEVEAMRKRAQDVGRALQAAQAGGGKAGEAIPTRLTPVAAWKNVGRGTANAALETALWAAAGGDLDVLSEAIVFTAGAREKAQALLDSLPEASRAQYSTPEKLVALMLSRDAGKVAGMQVLGQREVTPDDVGMRVRFGNENGETKDETFLLRRGGDGFRLMIPDAPVEKWTRQLQGGKK